MNKRAGAPGRTKPSEADIAQFEPLTVHELGRLLAAGKIALQRKLAKAKSARHHAPTPSAQPRHVQAD